MKNSFCCLDHAFEIRVKRKWSLRKKSTESKAVEIEKNDEIDIYEMKKIVAKRIVRIEKKKTENAFEIQNQMNWIKRSS